MTEVSAETAFQSNLSLHPTPLPVTPPEASARKLPSQGLLPRETDLRNSISALHAESCCRINNLYWLCPCTYTQFHDLSANFWSFGFLSCIQYHSLFGPHDAFGFLGFNLCPYQFWLFSLKIPSLPPSVTRMETSGTTCLSFSVLSSRLQEWLFLIGHTALTLPSGEALAALGRKHCNTWSR